MQVNLHGSLCITAVLLYCSLPLWGGGHPLPTPTLFGAFGASTWFAPSALDFGPPTSTPGSAYAIQRAKII